MAHNAGRTGARDELVDALLAASRALVGVAVRSLAGLDADVTLAQFRAMMVLATRGPQRMVDVAAELNVNPSTATRMCERLVRKALIRRERAGFDRREVSLSLTDAGAAIVAEVTKRRRAELVRIVAALPSGSVEPATKALRDLAVASGEPAEREWWLGWPNLPG
jgi:DNA-binding MarR family transcriptional regulator